MPYAIYKLIHFLGIFTLIAALASSSMHMMQGGTRRDDPRRRKLFALHGAASFLILLGGFGMLARIGVIHGALPGWVMLKLALWVVLAVSLAVSYRSARSARAMIVAVPLLALAAAAVALYKPL